MLDTPVHIKNILLVSDPWATLILRGIKTWEIRGNKLSRNKICTIGIAKSREKGMHRIYGVVDIVNCIGPLTLNELKNNYDKHYDFEDTRKLPYPKTYAWVLENPRLLKTPLDYEYKNGWVIWGVGDWTFDESDFESDINLKTMHSHDSELRKQFIDSLREDLSFFNIDVQFINLVDKQLTLFNDRGLSSKNESARKERLRTGFSKIQNKNKKQYNEELEAIEKQVLKSGLLAKKPKSIQELNLEIEIFRKNKSLEDIHWYFRMQQNIPSYKGIGCKIDVIIYHRDPCGSKHIVAVVGLSSPAYTSGGRDRLFGWNRSTDEARNAKNIGLKSITQINCLMVAEPYSNTDYRLTKLLTMIPFSSEVVEYYNDEYDSPLLAAISTSGFGLEAPMFNRINTNTLKTILKDIGVGLKNNDLERCQNIAHKYWHSPSYEAGSRMRRNNCVYYKEAETGSICFNMASDETKNLGKLYCESSGSIKHMFSKEKGFEKALYLAGIHAENFSIGSRGIYIGMLNNRFIKELKNGVSSKTKPISIPWDGLFKWWKCSQIKRLRG